MKILLGFDDSKFSSAAVHAVMAQAKPQSDEVRVTHVIDFLAVPIPDELAKGQDGLDEAAEVLVARAAELLRSKHLQVTTGIAWGNRKLEIIDAAAKWGADLIVLGSHDRSGLDRFLMGSVADAVMRHAHCSVELVRILPGVNEGKNSDETLESKFARILLAIDDSRFSDAAIQMLTEQLQSSETEIRILHVVEPPTFLLAMNGCDPKVARIWETQTQAAEDLVARAAKRFRGMASQVTTHVAHGDPKTKILDHAKEWKADLIVIGSHGRNSLTRFLLGSVSDAVARNASCSVEVVRSSSYRPKV